MANIKEEVETDTSRNLLLEGSKTEDSTNPKNTLEEASTKEEKCYEEMNCDFSVVKFEATNNFNRDLGNNSSNNNNSLNSKELRKCNRCGVEYQNASAYRKHYMKCWRSFRKRNRLLGSNKALSKVNKNFHKKNFTANNGDETFAIKRTCQVCGMHFKSTMYYTAHLRKKGFCRPPPFDCKNCGKTFKNIHHLVTHEKRKTPCSLKKSQLVPGEEEASFDRKRSQLVPTGEESLVETGNGQVAKKVTKIISKKHCSSSSNNLKCNKCNAQFTLFYWYNRHISSPSSCKPSGYKRNKGKISTIELSGKTSYSMGEYKTAEGYKCKKCGHVFPFPYRLLAHLQRKVPCTMQSSKKFVLSESTSPVKSLQQPLRTATSIHVQRKMLNSEKTSNVGLKIFKKYWKMKKAQPKKQNVIKYGTLICCICDKTFFNSYTWNSHLKIHSNVGAKCSVKCPVCFSIFPSANELHYHQQQTDHWGKLMKSRINHCKCPFCDKRFAYLGSRQNHVQRHLEDFPLEAKEFLDSTTCSYCESYFPSETKKLAHVRKEHPNAEAAEKKKKPPDDVLVHTEELAKNKDKMRYEEVNQLPSKNCVSNTRHKRNNRTGKVHSCSFCQKAFTKLENLIAHQQAAHSSSLCFQCSCCHQKFSNRTIIIHHVRKRHRNSKEGNLIIELGRSDEHRSEHSKPATKDQGLGSNIDSFVVNGDSSQELYSCSVCKISNFSKRASLIRHRKSRIHRRNLKLKRCGDINKLASPTRRIKHNNNSLEFNCSACSQSFKQLSSFIYHRLSHFNLENPGADEIDESIPYCCEICSKMIYHAQVIQTHLLSHLQQGKAVSVKCKENEELKQGRSTYEELRKLPKNSNSVISEPEHEDKVAAENLEVCQEEKLIKPLKKMNFTCKLCNKGFHTRRLWNQHVRFRCHLKRTCKYCKECFPSKKLFLLHKTQASCHIPGKKLHCQYCSLDFSSSSDLGWHEKSCQKVHGTGGEFNFNSNLFHCQYCQAPFLTLETCQEHENQFCKYTCTVCKVQFSSYDLLNQHMSDLHDKNQPLNCSVCGIHLKSHKALLLHLKTHKSEIDVKMNCRAKGKKSKTNKTCCICPHCNKSYQGFHSLKEHLVIHNPFKCPICGQIETDVRGFRKHPCRLPNGTFANGVKYRKKWRKARMAQKQGKYPAPLLTEHAHEEKIKEIPDQMEEDVAKEIASGNLQKSFCENSDKNELEDKVTLDVLRENFSQLLYLFVADPELMTQLGWGQRLIDDVLTDVLQNMGQNSVIKDSSYSELERLRENIRLLLKVCIKDQVMDAVDGENKLVDDIVIDMLGMCKASLENQVNVTEFS